MVTVCLTVRNNNNFILTIIKNMSNLFPRYLASCDFVSLCERKVFNDTNVLLVLFAIVNLIGSVSLNFFASLLLQWMRKVLVEYYSPLSISICHFQNGFSESIWNVFTSFHDFLKTDCTITIPSTIHTFWMGEVTKDSNDLSIRNQLYFSISAINNFCQMEYEDIYQKKIIILVL